MISLSFTPNCFQTEELVKALQDLENAASGDAAVRQKIASLPQEVQDVSLLEKITGESGIKGNISLSVSGSSCVWVDLAQTWDDSSQVENEDLSYKGVQGWVLYEVTTYFCQPRQGCSRQAVEDGRWSLFTAGRVQRQTGCRAGGSETVGPNADRLHQQSKGGSDGERKETRGDSSQCSFLKQPFHWKLC